MTVLQRPVFQDGQYLAAADLDAILAYARSINQARGLGAASWGVTSGLDLAERTGPSGVETWLTPGHAVDGYGNDLIVRSPLPVGPVLLQGKPSGAWFVWLALKPRAQQQIRPSYGVCEGTEAFARVGEDVEIIITGILPLTEQTSGVMLTTGLLPDPRLALRANDANGPFLLDGSVSSQLPHPAGLKARWLVPLGLAGWDSVTRQLRALTDDERKGARLFRRHAGVVAEQLLASGGLVRIIDRRQFAAPGAPDSEVNAIAAKAEAQANDLDVVNGRTAFKELLWVDGHSRLRGDARLFAGGIEWRDANGTTKNGAMSARRVQDDKKGNSELVIAIGEPGAPGKMARLVVGPNAAGADPGAATPVLTVGGDGKVGVNVREPAIALQINGAFGGLSGEVKGHFGTSSIIGMADGLLKILSGRNVVQIGEADHLVGINTVPTAGNALEVKGTVQINGATGTLRLLGSELIDDANGNFRIRSGGGVISFDGGDNIAIGHANPDPAYRLDVRGTIAVTSGPARLRLLGSELADEADGKLRLRSGGGIVAFDGNDNIAMGHDQPNAAYRLDVRGAIGITSGPAEMFLLGSRIADENDGILRIRSGGNIVTFDGSDNIGINTAAPSQRLDVEGNARVNGAVFGRSWGTISDRRLKTGIAPVKGALERLCAVEAVTFKWRAERADAEGGTQLGFIADEVEKVIPELVGTMPDGTKFIRNGMDAIQTAAIRELARKLEAAERRIAALEAKITVVKARKR